MDKQHILNEIRRTAKANTGVPLGWRKFESESGIRYYDWFGVYWAGWSDAIREAGLAPNKLQGAYATEELHAEVEHYADLRILSCHLWVEGKVGPTEPNKPRA